MIPTPIVISVTASQIKNTNNTLKISPNESGFLGEVIDGQHRYEGLLKNIEFHEYEVPICVFVDLSTEDKASIFSTINSTQVKVPKSYIYDLFDYTEENTPIKFSHEICKTLNYETHGPLHRRIKMLGKKLNDDELLSQAAFIDAFLPLISKNIKEDTSRVKNKEPLQAHPELPFRFMYLENNVTIFAKVISNYLGALRKISGDNWENYVLRSIGIKVFARLLIRIAPVGFQNNNLATDFFAAMLFPIEKEIKECSTSSGSNKGTENATVARFTEALDRTPPITM